MIAGDLHSNPVFLIYLFVSICMCSHLRVKGRDGQVVQKVTHSLLSCFHLLAAQFQWGGGQMEHRCSDGDRWVSMYLHRNGQKKGSSVCVCVGGFFCSFCCFAFFLLQGLFHRDRSGHSVAAADCLWVGLARQELCG